MRQSSVERPFRLAPLGPHWQCPALMPIRSINGIYTRYTNMSRENDDNLSSINSAYTDMYQETVKRFTRSSLSPEMDRYSSSSPISTKSNSKKSSSPKLGSPDRRLSFDLYVEATGRRRSSDHGAVLTVDTEQFIIGQRVWVGGVRPGQIAYIGETHFAPGEWAGVVLDEPNGKNDGCVSGKRYFQCEPKRGIFSRLTRLTLTPLPGAITPSSPLSKYTPDRSRTVSPTASVRSSALRSPIGKNGLTVGDRVIVSSGFGSRPGILRYLGETRFAPGNWCGVELDEPTGKNDGSVDGFRYFECQPKYGVFVPIAKVSLSPSSKKSRLSRAGSRESLTSIGTMNSVATTNTSRLRMSAQRKPSLIKPVSTPKSQFSMQDLLREKQNHIEQLMIERDLDREDAQNQALQFQKNISELQTRIHELERRLTDERKKTEDLQFSVDEATFCGDELNAQTQVYKEKIHDLEQTILQLSTSAPHHSILDPSIKNQAAENAVTVEVADEQISQLKTKLNEQAFAQEAQVAAFREEEKRLQDNIKYLQDQNEILQRELLEKDASLEKFSLSESGMENLRIELELLKQENERERQQIYAEYEQMLKASKAQVKELQEKLTAQSSSLANLEGERTNIEDECEILRAECKAQNKQLQDFTDQLLKAQQLGNSEGRSSLDEQIAEITKLKEKIDSLESVKMTLEADLQNSQTQLIKLREEQQQSEEFIRESAICNEEKSAAIKKLEAAMDELKQQVGQTEGENQQILVELKNLTELKADLLTAQNELKKQLEEKTKALEVTNLELQQAKEAIECLQQQLTNVNAESHKALTIKNTEVQSLTEEIKSLTEKAKAFESNSSTMVQQMSAKIQELEAQIKDLQQSLKSSEAELENQRLKNKKHEDTIAEKLAELAKASKELESTTSLLENLQEDNTSVQIKCSELQQELKQSYERNTQLELAVSDSRRKYKALNIKCDNYASQTESLQQDLLSIRSTSVEMQATMRNLNEELAARQKSFDELQNDSNAERFKLENRIEELQQKLIGSNKDFEELKENLQKTKEELSKRNEIITNLEEKTVKQELSLSDALRLQENLQTKYEALVAQNSSLQNDLTSLRSSSTDSNAELVKLSQDVAVKQRAYEELLDKSSSERSILESQLQASQQRVDTLCSQVEALTQELKATTEESFKRFEQLKQAEEKNSKHELELADAARKFDALEAKCLSLEAQNESLQKDLNVLRADYTDSSSAMLKLSEEVAKKQKALQECSDKASAENLQREMQIQELTMRFESAQAEINSLRKELQSAEEEKAKQIKELESTAAKVKIDAEKEMQSVQDKAAKERKGLCESFERQLKVSEENKIALDGTILQLEQQIQLLQYDLLRSQLDFQVKEEEHTTEAKAFVLEKERFNAMLQQMYETSETRIKEVQEEKAELIRSLQQLNDLLQQKEETLLKAYSNAEDIKLAQADSTEEIKKLEAQMKVLESTLEKTTEQLEHRTKLADNDKKEADELKAVMKTLQTSNVRMSITNADLSAALKKIESEKSETTHNFELFEIESDQNATQLRKARARLEEELSMKQQLLEAKDATLIVTQNRIEELTAQLEISQIDLNAEQAQTVAHAEMLAVLQQASEENTEALTEQEAQIQRLNATESNNQEILRHQEKLIGALRTQLAELKSSGPISVERQKREELELQLTEYRKHVEELDEASEEKTLKLIELQKRVNQLEQAKQAAQTDEQLRAAECVSLLNKLEKLEEEKLREVVALQKRINELQSANTNGKVKENGMETLEAVETNGTSAQINFLNSIIADMQKKNDMLKAKIEALENCSSDFTQPHAFDIIAKRKPAPRAFCDICDVFDQHETEDCPLQASSDREYSPPPFKLANPESNNNDTTKSKERKLPEPRKYCESCEVFGHETGECNDECY